MKNDDQPVKDFFKTLRERNEGQPVPNFQQMIPEPAPRGLPMWATLAAVINLALFFGAFWWQSLSETAAVAEKTVELPVENSTLMNWTTPTDKLLSDF